MDWPVERRRADCAMTNVREPEVIRRAYLQAVRRACDSTGCPAVERGTHAVREYRFCSSSKNTKIWLLKLSFSGLFFGQHESS